MVPNWLEIANDINILMGKVILKNVSGDIFRFFWEFIEIIRKFTIHSQDAI